MTVFVCYLVLGVRLAAVEPPDPDLARPGADLIPRDKLQTACGEAVANGILTLFERMHAPGNDQHFIYPPIEQRRVVRYEETTREVRYSEKVVTVPKVKRTYRTEERLVPKKNSSGEVVGYEKKTVRIPVKSEVVGQEKVKRLVRDPEGSIVRTITHRKPIYDEQGTPLVPEGWWGANAMGLYVLGKAGLGERREVQSCALSIEGMIHNYGMPDHTWDVAWLAMGLAQIPGENHGTWARRLGEKLLDGQLDARDRTLDGLWGPVSINHALVCRFFGIELELRKLIDPLEQQVAQGGDDPASKARAKNLAQLQAVLYEVLQALAEHTMHGKRLTSITKTLDVDSYKFAGLPYYSYNRLVADVDSTAIVALALAELAARGLLSEQTERPKPAGRQLVAPRRAATVLADGHAAIKAAMEKGGTYTAINASGVNHAYDKLDMLLEVPFKGRHPELLAPESLRSRVHGYVARRLLAQLAGREGQDGDLEDLESRAAEAIALVVDPAWNAKAPPHIHRGETIPLAELIKRKGILPVPDWEARPVADLAVGHLPERSEFLAGAMVLHRPLAEGAGRRHQPLHSVLAYRLLLAQQESGGWGRAGVRRYALGNAEYALLLEAAAARAGNPKRRRGGERDRVFDLGRYHRRHNHLMRRIDTGVFETCISLAYLQDNLESPIPLDEERIDAAVAAIKEAWERAEELQARIAEVEAVPAGERTEEQQQALEEARQQLGGKEFPGHLPRDNEALVDLWAAILARLGKELPVAEPVAEPAAPVLDPSKDPAKARKLLAHARDVYDGNPAMAVPVLDYLKQVRSAAEGTVVLPEVDAFIAELEMVRDGKPAPTPETGPTPPSEKDAEELLDDVLK